jgi:hypothetical protein
MKSYEFTLGIGGAGYLPDKTLDALYEATDGDAAIEHGPKGVFITIEQEAESLAAAITSAVTDVETVPGITVVGIAQEDGVTLADVARRVGRTRESVRLYTIGARGPGGFPSPDWTSSSGERFWSWTEVAAWFRDVLNKDIAVPPHELATADRLLAARALLRDEEAPSRAELVTLLRPTG